MSLIERAYELLTGQAISKNIPEAEPKKRGRPKKEIQPKTPKRRPSETFVTPDVSGPVRVIGNSFTDHGDLCREKLSKEEEVQLSRINSNLRNKEPQQENLVNRECKICKKAFRVKPVISGISKYYTCDNCLSNRK